MNASSNHAQFARTDLSVCIDQLQTLREKVRTQESFFYDHGSPYFDETIVLAHAHIDGAMRALRGILDRLNDIES